MENMHIDVRVYKVKITKQESIFTFSGAILFFFFFFFGSKIWHKLYLIIFMYFFIPSALAKYNAASIAPNFSQASVEDLFHRLVRYQHSIYICTLLKHIFIQCSKTKPRYRTKI